MKKGFVFCGVLFSSVLFSQEINKEKEKKIEGVTIVKTKKAVEHRPDRTIFDFSEQAYLNTGNLLEGVRKLPGLMVTEIGGMMYQGKFLEVYIDGRPLNIHSNELLSYLEGMPANSIERIEVITQPGAEFPATSGGAIMNIITNKRSHSYLSATYSGGYTATNYDKWRNRINNSVNLNAKNKLFGWQLRFGQNYSESMNEVNTDHLNFMNTDRIGRTYFAKAGITFDLGLDRLILNYDLNKSNNDNEIYSRGSIKSALPPFQIQRIESNDTSHPNSIRNEFVATYQKRFDDKQKKLDLEASYTHLNRDFTQVTQYTIVNNVRNNLNREVLKNGSNSHNANFKIDFTQPLKILDEGILTVGGLYNINEFKADSYGINNLDYRSQTASTYAELKSTYKKFNFIVGARAENYDISGNTIDSQGNQLPLTEFKKFKLFPNASVQYNFMNNVYLNFNYNKKITLPSISVLNPNNSIYLNSNTINSGNPFLQPTLHNNYEMKLSAFDYAFVSYKISSIKNQVTDLMSRKGDVISNRQVNIPDMRSTNLTMALPFPFALLNTPLSELLKFNVNPDKMNFMYFYASYTKHNIKGLDRNGFWLFNIMSQIVFPKDTKLMLGYTISTVNSGYFYYLSDKPFVKGLDIILTKKFLKDRLSVSIYANDVFDEFVTQAYSTPIGEDRVFLRVNNDTRKWGISLNYKFPTRNKNIKIEENILRETKEESKDFMRQ